MLTDVAINSWSLGIFLIFHSRDTDYAMNYGIHVEQWIDTKTYRHENFKHTHDFISLPMFDLVIFDINVQYTNFPSDIQISVHRNS